ncbi:MAG: PA2778 family cysteine peptidase [Gammaproteobacteria bacterium]
MLAGCASTPQSTALHGAPPPGLPAGIELAQTPFFPQTRYQCGPAALATVLATHGIDVRPEALSTRLYVPALRGSLRQEITATARRYGMLAYPLQASLEDLLGEIAHGNPVLVFQNLGLRWLPRWHYAVAVGYSLPDDEIILRSGTTRRWRSRLSTFERTWARGDHWAQVIVPAGQIPATAQPVPYLRAAHDLETGTQERAARAALEAATRHWPDVALAWMAYGNNRYAAADHAVAAQAFRRATRLAPEASEGWNNLAYALLRTGCPQQARRAARCAVSLSPGATAYQATLKEIHAAANAADGEHCEAVQCRAPAE